MYRRIRQYLCGGKPDAGRGRAINRQGTSNVSGASGVASGAASGASSVIIATTSAHGATGGQDSHRTLRRGSTSSGVGVGGVGSGRGRGRGRGRSSGGGRSSGSRLGRLWLGIGGNERALRGGLMMHGIACPRGLMTDDLNLTDFRLLRAIGHGCASTVFDAVHISSGIYCVVKICMKTRLHADEEHRFRREMNIHSGLSHPSILRFYASFEDRQAFYIVMEQAEKGDLLNYIRRKYGGTMSVSDFRTRVLTPMLKALCYLHEQGIIHRDVKPENILVVRDGSVKLCDFGFSINSYDERPKSYVGTLEYMAPEILEKKTHLFSEKLDIWSVGVLVYECLIGVSPFHMTTEKGIVTAILEGTYIIPSALTPEIVEFLKHCLHPNPNQRYTAKELLRMLKGKLRHADSAAGTPIAATFANSVGARIRSFSV